MALLEASVLANLVNSNSAIAILSILSFSESAFFIIPPEVLLIPMALASPQTAIFLGIITSVTSVLGAFFGYWLGQKGGKPILRKLFSEEKIEKVKILFNKYDASAILVSAFTPIPFKIFTVSAGAFDINLRRFAIASVVGRTTRYMIIAGSLYFYGESVRSFIEHDLNRFLAIATIAAIVLYFIFKIAIPYLENKYLSETVANKIKRLFSKTR